LKVNEIYPVNEIWKNIFLRIQCKV
jgi:hypothetical protein